MPPMNEQRSAHCTVIFDNKIYAIGGFQHGRSTETVEYYDGLKWKPAPPMHIPRSNFDAVVADGCIYVMGGHGHAGEHSIGNCEKFDGKSWTPIHCLPKPIAAGVAKFIEKPSHIAQLLCRRS
uniref:Uncharacterized protein n=1 Tax=Panagrolaimus davidi TaxID=227884 RepID=A0A914QQ19_9BILA